MSENSYRRKKQSQKDAAEASNNSILSYLTPRAPLSNITFQNNNDNYNKNLSTRETVTDINESPPRKRIRHDNFFTPQTQTSLPILQHERNSIINNSGNIDKIENKITFFTKKTVKPYMGLNAVIALYNREVYGNPRGYLQASKKWNSSTRHLMKDFLNNQQDVFRFTGEQGLVAPFACSFNNVAREKKYLAVADEEGTVGLIDARYDNTLETECARVGFRAHDNAIFDIMWSHDDKSLVTASGDQTACLWDVESQQSKATFCGHTCSIKSISYSALDPYLWSTASRDGNIFIWDIRTVGLQKSETMLYNPAMSILFAHSPESFRKKRKTYPFPVRSKPTSSVTGAQFLKHDENLLASSGALDNIIKYWDLRKLSNLRHANPVQVSISGATARRPHGISTLLINNDGSRLYANSTDNYVYMYDALNLGAPLTRFTAPDFRCSSFYVRMAISPDDQYIACGSTDKNIYIWEVDYPDVSPIVLKGHENEVTSLSWSKNFDTVRPSMFAVCYAMLKSQLCEYGYTQLAKDIAKETGSQTDLTPSSKLSELLYIVKLQDEENNEEEMKPCEPPIDDEPDSSSSATEDGKTEICMKTGKYAATGSVDASLKVLDTSKMNSRSDEDRPVIRTLYDHLGPVNDLSFHPNGLVLASLKSIAFHPSGDYILAGTDNESVRVYDVKKFQCFTASTSPSDIHKDGITKVRFSSNGSQFVTSSLDGSIKIWDTISGRCIKTIESAHDDTPVSSAKFSKTGKFILSGGKDSTARLWDANTGKLILKYEGANQSLQTTFTYNEDYILGSDEVNYNIICWDSRTSLILKKLGGHTNIVRCIAASPTEPGFISCG
nr:2069_t:CDS:10 [Entrophospora candida]